MTGCIEAKNENFIMKKIELRWNEYVREKFYDNRGEKIPKIMKGSVKLKSEVRSARDNIKSKAIVQIEMLDNLRGFGD